jgi:hypothetical protein
MYHVHVVVTQHQEHAAEQARILADKEQVILSVSHLVRGDDLEAIRILARGHAAAAREIRNAIHLSEQLLSQSRAAAEGNTARIGKP